MEVLLSMNVGIIVYSKTNNTLSVAEKLLDVFSSKGVTAELLPITVKNNDPTVGETIILDKTPDCEPFDLIILGSPVWAFSLCPVMKQYVLDCNSFDNKNVFCFVTQHFPFACLGGNRSVRALKKLCQNKGANVKKTHVVNWSSKKRENNIDTIIKDFTNI